MWVDVLAMILFAVLAVVYGKRAKAKGSRWYLMLSIVGALVAVGFLVLTVSTLLLVGGVD